MNLYEQILASEVLGIEQNDLRSNKNILIQDR